MEEQAFEVLRLFRSGRNTHEISVELNLPESFVSRLLWVARCWDRGLPAVLMNKARELKHIAPKQVA